MKRKTIIPIILCGGTGSRLWPLSRQSYPKQYLSFDGNDEKSLLQVTQERIKDVKNIQEPILICNEDHRFIVAEQMKAINVKPNSILLEPFGRNTAPAITISSLLALEKDDDPICIVLSSDHEIKDNKKFIEVINNGILHANQNRLVTFGVIPDSPETGYGYIEAENELNPKNIKGEKILRFIEKPNLEKAKKLILNKKFSWNSGIFMFKANVMLSEMERFCPDLVKFSRESLKGDHYDLDFRRLNKEAFERCPNLSIDVAVMEKTNIGTVLPLNAGWSDLGSWNSVWKSNNKDHFGNVIRGKVLSKETKNCLIKSNKRLIVGIGLEDLVVVETSDAILVANKNYDQEIKNIVQELKNKGFSEGQVHQKVFRPWGSYSSVANESRWQVKLIKVKPGASLSLQKHHHRSEHWIIVSGTAKIEIDQKSYTLCENQSTYIPLGSIHRLSNPGKIELSLIEVQSGSYLGEDDIERFEDNYGRS